MYRITIIVFYLWIIFSCANDLEQNSLGADYVGTSESLDIMYEMCIRGKIDKEIFKVFLDKKLYMKYAHKHIHKNQIDKIDINRYSFT